MAQRIRNDIDCVKRVMYGAMISGFFRFRRNILNQTSAVYHIDELHAITYSHDRQFLFSRRVVKLNFEMRPASVNGICFPRRFFMIETRMNIGTADYDKSIDMFE